jgi:hypothetical protein
MRTVSPRVMYITAIVIIIFFVFWIVALFYGYLADDWSSPPADERSVPAPVMY